uniref:Uncharacterized protein n=1 Tax=Arundo donax TaxID=35708 RepID=A0A0A9BT37_ARUDO
MCMGNLEAFLIFGSNLQCSCIFCCHHVIAILESTKWQLEAPPSYLETVYTPSSKCKAY